MHKASPSEPAITHSHQYALEDEFQFEEEETKQAPVGDLVTTVMSNMSSAVQGMQGAQIEWEGP